MDIDPNDPIKLLASAIKQNETGSGDTYNAPVGKDGEVGAYRFLPSTWSTLSGKYLQNPNAPLSVENQNTVAYQYIKELKDKGYDPKEIASIWNSGQPENAYNPHQGKSNGGAQYNTPQYADKVYNTYLQLKANSASAAPTVQEDHGFLGNLAADAIKPFARLATNIGQAGEILANKPLTTPYSGSFLGDVQPMGAGIDVNKPPWDSQNVTAIKDAMKNGVDIGSWFGGAGAEKEILKEGLIGFLKKAMWNTAKVGGTVGAIQGASTGLEPGATPGSTVVNTIKGGAEGFGTGLALGPVQALGARSLGWLTGVTDQKAAQEATARVQDMISPKLTTREARIAMNEKRFVPEKPSSWLHPFTPGTPDMTIPSVEIKNATRIIQEQIPGADKMKPPQLFDAVDRNVTKIATELRPVLEDIPVNRQTVQKITDDVSGVRKTLIDSAPATEEANVLKRQKSFETLLQKSKTWSMADLWDTAIDYDKTVSSAVKNADLHDPKISDSIRQQKIEWLQRRDILKNAINDPNNGGGAVSDKAFADMKAMYNAKSGILSNVSVNLTPEASKASQLVHSSAAKYGIGFGLGTLGLGGAYEAAKHFIPELP